MRNLQQFLSVLLVVFCLPIKAQQYFNELRGIEETDVPLMSLDMLRSSVPVGTIEGEISVSPTGSAVYTIPIELPAGFPDATPQLSLVYNSQQGNGICGCGFSISGISSITRVPQDIYHDGKAKGIARTLDDAFCLDGQRMMLLESVEGCDTAVYYLESDPYTRIILHGRNETSQSQAWFDVHASNGMRYSFSAKHIYHNTAGQEKVSCWYPFSSESPVRNSILYNYTSEGAAMFPSEIRYGSLLGNFVRFEYEIRPDTIWLQTEDIETPMVKRLKSIETGTALGSNQTYRKYTLNYSEYDGSASKFSRITSITVSNGLGESLRPTRFSWTNLPSYGCTRKVPSLSPGLNTFGADNNEMSFFSADLNGDGLSDLVQTGLTHEPAGSQSHTFIRTYFSSINGSGDVSFNEGDYLQLPDNLNIEGLWQDRYSSPMAADVDGDGINELHVPIFFNSVDARYFGFKIFKNGADYGGVQYYDLHADSFDKVLWSTADFNNDGKCESVIVEKVRESSNLYYGAIIGGYSPANAFCKFIRFTLPQEPRHIFAADMNADGMTDVVVFYQFGYSVFWNDGSWIDDIHQQQQSIGCPESSAFTTFINPDNVWTGDFNGDGHTDFLIAQKDNGHLYFGIGKGNGSITCTIAATTNVYDQSATDKDDHMFTCIVTDIDGDGKSDVVLNKGMFEEHGGTLFEQTYYRHDKTYTYWFFSDGKKLKQHKVATSKREKDACSQFFAVGDFNGDGLAELASFSYDCYSGWNADTDPVFRIYKNTNYRVGSGKIASVINGLDNRSYISYSSLTDGGIYTKASDSHFPVVDISAPLHAVSELTTDNGIAGLNTTSYTYEGMKVHLQGLGFLGMTATSVSNANTGLTVEERIVERDSISFKPIKTTETQYLNGQTSTHTEECVLTNHSTTNSRVLSIKETVSFDYDGNRIRELFSYAPNMNDAMLAHYTWFDDDKSAAEFYEYGYYGGTYKTTKVTSQQSVGVHPLHEDITSYAYDAYGQLVSKTEHDETELALRTSYRYNSNGQVINDTVYGNGVQPVITQYSYDYLNRFLTGKLEQGYIRTEYTCDSWGHPTTVTDKTRTAYPQETSYVYDGWGNVSSTTSPEGVTTNFTRQWIGGAQKKYYILEEQEGRPWVKTWYDNTGREVLKESIGPKGAAQTIASNYDSKGQIISKIVTNGHQQENAYYTYDARGRLLTDMTTGNPVVSHSYARRMVTTTIGERTNSKRYDSWGNVVQSTDPVTTVNYVYGSNGKPISVTSEGTTVSMDYDDVGNQTQLTDPDAGTMTYAYDVLGRIISQTDGRGITTTYTYNSRGQLATKVIDGKSTVYTYGQTVNDNGLLLSASRDGYTATYQYDSHNRLVSESRYFKKAHKTLTMSYAYNSLGQLASRTFPGQLQVNYEYDDYGFLERIHAANNLVYERLAYTGDSSVVRLGQDQTYYELYESPGRLSMAFAHIGDIEDEDFRVIQEYIYETSTGNLAWRQIDEEDNVQSFAYDSLDRLVSVEDGSVTEHFAYTPNGNLVSKSGLQLAYNGGRPHAVTAVSPVMGGLDEVSESAVITYNELGKLSSIYNQKGDTICYYYGPDEQRWETKGGLYFDDYEERYIDGERKCFIYLEGGVLCVQDSQGLNIYCMYTDNQGSVIEILDSDAIPVFKATYDAWGRQTITRNDIGFYRGYTGHEMMPEFGLINMNGRVYDPLLGRFLSPDNFVQQPDNSQNFNRYSYCLNNPLKYTDPDGEWIHIVIGAVVGGVINVVSKAVNGQINSFWDGLAAFGIGAGAGALATVTGGAGYTAVAGNSAGGFFAGFASGAVGSIFSMSTQNIGNHLYFGDPIMSGKEFVLGVAASAFTSGVLSGVVAEFDGRKFFTGIEKTTTLELNPIEPVSVTSEYKASNSITTKETTIYNEQLAQNDYHIILYEKVPQPRVTDSKTIIIEYKRNYVIKGYSSRVLPNNLGAHHSFPTSFDSYILNRGFVAYENFNSTIMAAPGIVNDVEGFFTVGISNNGIIYHRCFYDLEQFAHSYPAFGNIY